GGDRVQRPGRLVGQHQPGSRGKCPGHRAGPRCGRRRSRAPRRDRSTTGRSRSCDGCSRRSSMAAEAPAWSIDLVGRPAVVDEEITTVTALRGTEVFTASEPGTGREAETVVVLPVTG